MTLKILNVKGFGDISQERVVLQAPETMNIGRHIITVTHAHGEGIFKILLGIWLPTFEVSKNDLVVVYTKAGEPKKKTNLSGKVTHFYYMGEPAPILDKGVVQVMALSDWSYLVPQLEDIESTE